MFTRSIPNIFTIANLFLGILAILFAFNNKPELAAMLVIIAMVTDGLDGHMARLLNVQSEFGKELDSLSDVVSFGVAPAFIIYTVAFQDIGTAGWLVTAIFPICGALRLARFNVVSGTPGYFIGLPIPAAGGALATLALFASNVNAVFLLLIALILSFLMVSNVKYPSFKKGGIPKAAKWIAPILLIIAVILAIQYKGLVTKLLFVPLVLYALFGLKKNVSHLLRFLRIKKKRADSSVDDSIKYHDV